MLDKSDLKEITSRLEKVARNIEKIDRKKPLKLTMSERVEKMVSKIEKMEEIAKRLKRRTPPFEGTDSLNLMCAKSYIKQIQEEIKKLQAEV